MWKGRWTFSWVLPIWVQLRYSQLLYCRPDRDRKGAERASDQVFGSKGSCQLRCIGSRCSSVFSSKHGVIYRLVVLYDYTNAIMPPARMDVSPKLGVKRKERQSRSRQADRLICPEWAQANFGSYVGTIRRLFTFPRPTFSPLSILHSPSSFSSYDFGFLIAAAYIIHIIHPST